MKKIFLLFIFISLSIHSAVIKITKGQAEDATLLVFQDQHRGTRNFIDMKALDGQQKQPLWEFYNGLKDVAQSPAILLEVSSSERKKLARLPAKVYEKKSFRKQLGYHLAQGQKTYNRVTLLSWDERDEVQRNVSWMLANVIDTLLQVYQEKYQCKAEETCMAWFDEKASDDFFNAHPDDSFHAKVRHTVEKALLGKSLSNEEKKLGFWAIDQVPIATYMNGLDRAQKRLETLVQDSHMLTSLAQKLQTSFATSKQAIKELCDTYIAKHPARKATINQMLLDQLQTLHSLDRFDTQVYAPMSAMSVLLGDISLLATLFKALEKHDVIIVYAGANHSDVVIEYMQAKNYGIENRDVLSLSFEHPDQFATELQKLLSN